MFLRDRAYNSLESYLENRKQYVSINGINSECNVVILGPKLFILYINDLCNSSSLLKFVLFADDTNLFF